MKSRQQCKQKYSTFDDDDNDDEYYVRLQKQFEQLNLDHLRVLDDASDEDQCAQFSPLRSSQRSRNRLRKQPVNPILLSAQFRDASADLDEAQRRHGHGLTYVDCLLFEEERRKRRNAKQKEEAKQEWPRRQIRVCRVQPSPSPPPPPPPVTKHSRPLYEDSAPSECEKKSPDSAFGSEDGSSNDPRVECEKEEVHRNDALPRMTSWKDIKERSAGTRTEPQKRPVGRIMAPANHHSPLLKSIDFQQLAAQRRRQHLNNACLYSVLAPRPSDDIPTPACSSNDDEDDAESEEHCDM